MARSKSSDFSVGAAARFCNRFAKAFGSPTDLQILMEDPAKLAQMVAVARGQASVEIGSVRIDCSKPVDLVALCGDDYKYEVHKQPLRVEGFCEIDLRRIRLEHTLRDSEFDVPWEERMSRHSLASYTLLDLRVLEFLLANQHLIPVEWRGTEQYSCVIFFDGTILLMEVDGEAKKRQAVVGLSWDFDQGGWGVHVYDEMEWRDSPMWDRSYPSAVLMPSA